MTWEIFFPTEFYFVKKRKGFGISYPNQKLSTQPLMVFWNKKNQQKRASTESTNYQYTTFSLDERAVINFAKLFLFTKMIIRVSLVLIRFFIDFNWLLIGKPIVILSSDFLTYAKIDGQPLISSVYLAWSILQLSKAHFIACLQI